MDELSTAILRYQEGETAVLESAVNGRHCLWLKWKGKEYCYELYRQQMLTQKLSPKPYYLGHKLADVLASGRDLLGEEILSAEEPSWANVKDILPPIQSGAYCCLSGALSWGSVTIDSMGRIIPQLSGQNRQPTPIFSPTQLDAVLGDYVPVQHMAGGHLPLLSSVHTDGINVLAFLYFVEPGDPDRDPIVWIRTCRYCFASPEKMDIDYCMASASRAGVRQTELSLFWDALCSTLVYWVDYTQELAEFSLPEPELQNAVIGTMVSLGTTFSGDHAHYGHRGYGSELHDHFPPNVIWAIETCCVLGQTRRAQRYLEHLLLYGLDYRGRFVYRQGPQELRGASAEEYGQLLFTVNRYATALHLWDWIDPYYAKLTGMGYELLQHRKVCPEFGGKRLIRMCAEADTNTRVYVYSSNNLWAIRGLQALSQIMRTYGDVQAESMELEASSLEQDFRAVLDANREDSPYGPLVPFRLGYTVQPLTLSSCSITSRNNLAQEQGDYYIPSDFRTPIALEQDYTENTYANYRYYPEMLSSMLLTSEESKALVAMRENIGGELLGMTRFYDWLDDWPVAHYSRYLLETNQISKYLLLLYAHTAHHGHADLMNYYEQVSANGRVLAPDCVPSLLTTPLLTAWMFAYEPMVTSGLELLKAIPRAWFDVGFSVSRLGTTHGTIDLSVIPDDTKLRVCGNLEHLSDIESVSLWVRCRSQICLEDILSGSEAIANIDGNCLQLSVGVTSFEIVLRVR